MKPRLTTALLLLTMPVWFLPVCCWVGFREAGIDALRDVPAALSWAIWGKRP